MGKLGLSEDTNIDLLIDSLYGGFAGLPHEPEYFLQDTEEDSLFPDPKLSQNNIKVEKVPTEEVFKTNLDESVDVRPRVFDNISKKWLLADTGSQVTCLSKGPDDTLQPHIRLEAVNGSVIPCYGKKMCTVRFGRKEYHIEAFITDTTEDLLGSDFINKYRLEFRWGEFDDLYLYDKKSNISTLCEFIKTPRGSFPSVARVSVVNSAIHWPPPHSLKGSPQPKPKSQLPHCQLT